MSENITASAYLVVKANRYQWGVKDPETGLRHITDAKIAFSRQSRPAKLGPDEVLVKVTVQLPKSVFDPIMPQALIVVPEDLVLDRHAIEAEASDDAAGEQ